MNSVWIDDCRVWAREARFDRFAHNDVVEKVSSIPVTKVGGIGNAVVVTRGEGVKNVRLDKPVQVDGSVGGGGGGENGYGG